MKSFTDIITDFAESRASIYKTYRRLREHGYTFQEIRRIVIGIRRAKMIENGEELK